MRAAGPSRVGRRVQHRAHPGHQRRLRRLPGGDRRPAAPLLGRARASAIPISPWSGSRGRRRRASPRGPAAAFPPRPSGSAPRAAGIEGARYPWGDARPAERFARPPTVGRTPANGFGLTDLSGVCHEWCADWFDEALLRRAPARNPRGPATGTRRVSRGGAWRHADPWSAVAHRSSLPPDLRYSDYGVPRGPGRLARRLRRRQPGAKMLPRPHAMARAQRSVLREGIIAGLIGATVVAVWFLAFDFARGRPVLHARPSWATRSSTASTTRARHRLAVGPSSATRSCTASPSSPSA